MRRRALVAGPTGLVGRKLVQLLHDDPDVTEVVARAMVAASRWSSAGRFIAESDAIPRLAAGTHAESMPRP